MSLGPSQLVEVDGCNIWIMKETVGLSSDPPQAGHLKQKVHAQQSIACSLEKSAKLPEIIGTLL